ncbi:MAG TPA: hypothetical protein VGA03_01850 [Anaerolineales bacterium]
MARRVIYFGVIGCGLMGREFASAAALYTDIIRAGKHLLGEKHFGRVIEVEAGFWHSSDMDPTKPINWKCIVEINGEYGCMGDLGLHVVHVLFRAGWRPDNVRALVSNVVTERPGPAGELVPCETWDNAILACQVGEGAPGSIFEFGLPDAILQMWAAFCDELANGREGMSQPFSCATPEEAKWSHALFTAALQSQAQGETARLAWPA